MKKRIAFIVSLLTILSSQIALADSGVVNTDSLRVRQKPSLTSSISGYISKNTKINTLGKDGDFYKISYNGKTGYVHTSYINIVKSKVVPKPVVAVKPKVVIKPVVVAKPIAIPKPVVVVKPIVVPKPVVTVKPVYIEKYGQTTGDILNVRSGAGSTYSVIGSLKLGSKVTLYDNTNGFYKIIYLGKTAYISALFVKVTGEKPPVTTSTSSPTTPVEKSTGVGTVTASDFLSVRKTPSLNNDVVVMGKIYPKDKVDIYGTQGEFYKIKFNGQWGYIYKTYVSVVSDILAKAQYIADGQQYVTKATGDNLVTYSNKFLGMPYIWGGTTPAIFNTAGKYLSGGFDCSGLVQYSYKNFGINLPRTTMDQVDKGAAVNINNLKNGDLVFFTTNVSVPSEVSHVGIYIGNNKFMHSPKPGEVIKITELSGYYIQNFVVGKRIIS